MQIVCLHTKEKLYSHHTEKALPFPTVLTKVLILRSSAWDKCLLLNQPCGQGLSAPFASGDH